MQREDCPGEEVCVCVGGGGIASLKVGKHWQTTTLVFHMSLPSSSRPLLFGVVRPSVYFYCPLLLTVTIHRPQNQAQFKYLQK